MPPAAQRRDDHAEQRPADDDRDQRRRARRRRWRAARAGRSPRPCRCARRRRPRARGRRGRRARTGPSARGRSARPRRSTPSATAAISAARVSCPLDRVGERRTPPRAAPTRRCRAGPPTASSERGRRLGGHRRGGRSRGLGHARIRARPARSTLPSSSPASAAPAAAHVPAPGHPRRAARLGDQQRAGMPVPRLDVRLDPAVQPAGGDPGELQRAAADRPQRAELAQRAARCRATISASRRRTSTNVATTASRSAGAPATRSGAPFERRPLAARGAEELAARRDRRPRTRARPWSSTSTPPRTSPAGRSRS